MHNILKFLSPESVCLAQNGHVTYYPRINGLCIKLKKYAGYLSNHILSFQWRITKRVR